MMLSMIVTVRGKHVSQGLFMKSGYVRSVLAKFSVYSSMTISV